MHIKKRPFILLELFLALALISLSIIPIASYPFKITQKELSTLIEIQLQEIAEVAFKDLLLDSDCLSRTYTIALNNDYKWEYLATWEIEYKTPTTEPYTKSLLQATLNLTPPKKSSGIIKLPNLEVFFEYFIEAKEDNKESASTSDQNDD